MKIIHRVGWGAAVALPLAFLVYFFLFPIGSMLVKGITVTGVGASEDSFLGGVADVLGDKNTWQIILQTLRMALAGTVFSVILGIPGAYTLYCLDFPGRQLLRGIITVPFVLPTVVVGIAFRALFDGPFAFLGMAGTTRAIVVAMVFFNFSVIARTVGTMWANLDPRPSLAARTLGASPARAFFTVTLPQLMPAAAAGAGLVFLYCSTAYGIVTTLGNPGYGTLETEIYTQTVAYFNLDRAAIFSLLQFVLVFCTLVVTTSLSQRTETALKVRRRPYRSVRRQDCPAMFLTLLTVVFVALPLATLVLRSLRENGQWSLYYYRSLGQTTKDFVAGTPVAEALVHSVKIALDATCVTLLVGVPLTLVLSHRVTGVLARCQKILDGLVLLPAGVSTVTVGFGFLLTFAGTAVGDSPMFVPLAQSVVALPLFIRALVPLLRAIDPRMREAAATLGASSGQIVRTVDLPFMFRGLGLATGFAFAVSLGEFGATSFLANPAYQTLPVTIVKLLAHPGKHNYGMALAGAVVLAAVTAGTMMLAEMCSARDAKEKRSR